MRARKQSRVALLIICSRATDDQLVQEHRIGRQYAPPPYSLHSTTAAGRRSPSHSYPPGRVSSEISNHTWSEPVPGRRSARPKQFSAGGSLPSNPPHSETTALSVVDDPAPSTKSPSEADRTRPHQGQTTRRDERYTVDKRNRSRTISAGSTRHPGRLQFLVLFLPSTSPRAPCIRADRLPRGTRRTQGSRSFVLPPLEHQQTRWTSCDLTCKDDKRCQRFRDANTLSPSTPTKGHGKGERKARWAGGGEGGETATLDSLHCSKGVQQGVEASTNVRPTRAIK